VLESSIHSFIVSPNAIIGNPIRRKVVQLEWVVWSWHHSTDVRCPTLLPSSQHRMIKARPKQPNRSTWTHCKMYFTMFSCLPPLRGPAAETFALQQDILGILIPLALGGILYATICVGVYRLGKIHKTQLAILALLRHKSQTQTEQSSTPLPDILAPDGSHW
jgi:hypothetical protein